jgi:hypothetical protein
MADRNTFSLQAVCLPRLGLSRWEQEQAGLVEEQLVADERNRPSRTVLYSAIAVGGRLGGLNDSSYSQYKSTHYPSHPYPYIKPISAIISHQIIVV